ncbi:MAG TPA: hypothetical protein VMV88_01345 [Gallionella sp.]|nr:hypothetical protein [Gallionella sp.]
MRRIPNDCSKTTINIAALLAILGLLVLSGCNPGKPNGVFLIINLENSENIKQYTVFNPYDSSVAVCNSSAKEAIAQLLASVPAVIPKDSRIMSWRCSLTAPETGQ